MTNPTSSTEPEQRSVGREAAHGAMWLGLTQGIRVFLTLVATVFVARLLTPADYGVVAMTAPLFTLIIMFQDFGLGAATIQARTLTHEQSSGMFWATMMMSAVLALLLLLISPLVAWFYHDPRPGRVAAAGAISVLIAGLALQHGALLNREMRFASIARLEITGLVVTYGVTLLLAWQLRSYWALFLGSLAGGAVQGALNWVACKFRPGRPHLRDIGDLARFGGHITGFNFLNFLIRNLDTILVARFTGPAQAGVYDRSYKLLMLPLTTLAGPITRVLQPVLRDLRDRPDEYRRVFNLMLRALALVIIPPVAITAVLAKPFMLMLLGHQWGDAGAVYFWLALVGLMQPSSNPVGLLYMTNGRSADLMRWGGISGAVTVLGFIAAAPYGARGMAFAFFCSALLLMPIRFGYAARNTPVRASDLYAAQFLPLIGAGSVAVLAFLASDAIPFLPLLIGATALAYLATFATTSITARGRAINLDLLRYVRRHAPAMVKRQRAAR